MLPLSKLDPTAIADFWDFLTQFIGEGRAGFGVRAFREMQEKNTHEGDSETYDDHTSKQREEVLTVYCWGEVVGEIWMVLYLGSKRKAKGLGAKWIDASEKVVLVMK